MNGKIIFAVALSVVFGGAFVCAYADSSIPSTYGSTIVDQSLTGHDGQIMLAQNGGLQGENTWQRDRENPEPHAPLTEHDYDSMKQPENTWQRDRVYPQHDFDRPAATPRDFDSVRQPENTWQRDRVDPNHN